MPWTSDRYPPAMRNLPPRLRMKAIEISNAVLSEHGDEGKAIRIGIAKAREWGAHRQVPEQGVDPFWTDWD